MAVKRSRHFKSLFSLLASALIAVSYLVAASWPSSAFAKPVERVLSLSVGLYHDEKIPLAPTHFGRDGTYRRLVQLRYNPHTKVLRFEPKRQGFGTLIIKDAATGAVIYEFQINVKKTDLQQVAREIQSLLHNIEGISIKIINHKVIVDGQILLPRDMKRIHDVIRQYGDKASSLVTLSPLAQTKIAQFIERDINNPEIHCRAVNGKFILEGWASSKKEKDKAEILAKAYVPDVVVDQAEAEKKVLPRKSDVVINLIQVKPPAPGQPKKIIQLVIHYVELSKDYTRGFRFQWTPDLGDGTQISFSSGGNSPGGVVSSITGTVSNLLPKLNWAKEHGHARILQSSSLIVQEGTQGILNSESKIPYQVVNAQGQPSTNFQNVGLRAKITPSLVGAHSDSVNLKMEFSVSSLISYTSQGPLTSSREIETAIVVRSGQSAAVGGLITNDSLTNYNKLPNNATSNPLISLYASKDFSHKQSQFVVFITPIIKSSASAGAEKIKKKFRLSN